jgi:hypothetical protein
MAVSICYLPDVAAPGVDPSFLTVTPSKSSAEKGENSFRIEACGEDVGTYFACSDYGKITFNQWHAFIAL